MTNRHQAMVMSPLASGKSNGQPTKKEGCFSESHMRMVSS